MSEHDIGYPFGALAGQESLKVALLIAAVDPTLGGVLIRGEKGTAKSTAARGLSRLLPTIRAVEGCPFRCDIESPWPDCPSCAEAVGERRAVESHPAHVELPIGATEDRVLGTLDLDRVLKEGRSALRPGLLARAHRGVLYVDEVNLLPDHLVDGLLDVAASGINTVERDGISARHPARFLLIGSMNPEEGELRPQLLDRFGLMVEVAAPRDYELRAEVVRRRLEFEADPAGFAACWDDEDRAIGIKIAEARQRLRDVVVAPGLLTAIARLCCESQVDGLRADIALFKASRALAALDGRDRVRRDDLRTAAEYVLPHRRRRQPFQQPGLDREAIDRALGPDEPEGQEPGGHGPASPPPTQDGTGGEDDLPDFDGPRPSPAPDEDDSSGEAEGDGEEQVIAPGDPPLVPRLELETGSVARDRPAHPGKRMAGGSAGRGPFIRAVADESPRELAVDATLRAAVRRSPGTSGVPAIERSDLHGKVRAAQVSALIVFVVDTSGSMGARRRMEATKGAILGLLGDAYRRRDRVAVVACRGPRAEVVLPPSRSVDRAEAVLRQLPTGGRTPLAHALTLAADLIVRECQGGPAMVVLLTDGRANVPLPGGEGEPWTQALAAGERLASVGASAVVFDTEEGFGRVGRVPELAAAMGADHLPLAGLSADAVIERIDPPGLKGGRR
ncbi:magnesium chelatase subunit D family protein [Singulisphaera sp. PoT]|uniref:magnesium chelatase subunit D family protein n=1 Tax=Singulisphaera sp. PoT TaxID=3411797 RepID=UPI003BF4E935